MDFELHMNADGTYKSNLTQEEIERCKKVMEELENTEKMKNGEDVDMLGEQEGDNTLEKRKQLDNTEKRNKEYLRAVKISKALYSGEELFDDVYNDMLHKFPKFRQLKDKVKKRKHLEKRKLLSMMSEEERTKAYEEEEKDESFKEELEKYRQEYERLLEEEDERKIAELVEGEKEHERALIAKTQEGSLRKKEDSVEYANELKDLNSYRKKIENFE